MIVIISEMEQLNQVLDGYDKTAEAYANAFSHELSYKPIDRMLLTRFAEENRARGPILDLGCGPGQTTVFLHQVGLTDVVGTDVSPAMIAQARQRNASELRFEVADMLQLPYQAETFGGALAFYSIVHLTMDELTRAFDEVYRILKPQGQFLLAFHALDGESGQRVNHRTDFFDQPVDLTFYFFEMTPVLAQAQAVGFERTDALVRYPYAQEYPSKRAYILLTKP
jgi:ubiquinone/menaquinone biosynthesis C-methylase UbiE